MTVDTKVYELKDKDGKRYLLESYLEAIRSAHTFMQKVIYEKETYFTSYTTMNGKQMKTVSSIGKHLRSLGVYSDLFSTDYTFSPLITFFFEHYRKHPIMGHVGQSIHNIDVEMFDDFLTAMRKDAVTINLKKTVADWNSKSKKNSIRLIKLQNELFKRYARLMVIRLDLNYHAATFTQDEINQIMSHHALQKQKDFIDFYYEGSTPTIRSINGRVALEDVQIDRKRLFSNMKGKTSLFKHLVGYVWTIEHGRAAGYHMHVMLFFDGAYTQKHEYIAQEIGKYWVKEITNGRGYFENCNRKKEKYLDSWALGEINHWDSAKRKNLDVALQYFCKTNQMVQVVPYPGCRLFGSGFMHRKGKSNKGRPRKQVENGHGDLQIFA